MGKREEKAIKIMMIQSEVNSPKSRLLSLMNDMFEVCPAEAEKLGKIIARLEDWQNRRRAQ